MQNTNPILRWAGSKRSAIQYLQKYWSDDFKRYIEPFCGSAALFFQLSPKEAILSDLNSDLISFYNHCKTRHGVIWRSSSGIPVNAEKYYEIRKEYNSIGPSLRKSALFLYLNRTCFNGIYRTNRSGGFNVPFSGKKISRFPAYPTFRNACTKLAKVDFRSIDFEEMIRDSVKEGDFVFMDPPYATNGKRTFTEYNKGIFTGADIERVIRCMEIIDQRGAHFVCTYDGHEQDRFSIAQKWLVDGFEVRRNVGGFVSSRKIAHEIILSNIRT